jgi:hypothetical protein
MQAFELSSLHSSKREVKARSNLCALCLSDSFAAAAAEPAAAPQSAISQSTSASESTTSEPIAAPGPLATSLAAAAVTGTFFCLKTPQK